MDIDTVDISLDLGASAPGTQITIKIDDQTFWQGDPYGAGKISTNMPDVEGDHVLEIVLSGKTAEHTRMDADGKMIQDLMVDISNITIDDVSVAQMCYEKSTYTHDFNGTREPVKDKFFGHMGCNGTVRLEFACPVYLWMLENL